MDSLKMCILIQVIFFMLCSAQGKNMWKVLKKYKNKLKSRKKTDLPKSLKLEVKKFFNETHTEFIKDEGAGAEFECETAVSRSIFRLYPRATYRWVRNEGFLTMEPERMVFRMGDLIIQGLKATDTGLYSCRLHYTKGKVLTVGVFSLYVKSQEYPETPVYEGRKISLQCNSHLLGLLYPKAVREWYLNGTKTPLQKIPANQKHNDVIKKSTVHMQGNWSCVVRDPVHNWKWTTAFYRVKIYPPLKGIAFIIDFVKHNVKLTIFLVIGCFCLVMMLTAILIDKLEQWKKRKDKLQKRMLYQFIEDSGRGFYDNNDNLCYTDEDGNVVVCKVSDDESDEEGMIKRRVKQLGKAGKAALEKTKDFIEGEDNDENKNNDANENAADLDSTYDVCSSSFEDDKHVSFFEGSLTEDSFETSFSESRPLLSHVNCDVSFS
ncbi:uncharacterized protein LOC133187500 [Saccostrea echinata]|uniref:uncharacterized protein LOC133187500 n=1 Tax=Saccostrea echinata TaxID=191078 RepID=UPI002A7FF4D0|nr:uncharacterized protein LOC133187500 [Saccostrea echinata]